MSDPILVETVLDSGAGERPRYGVWEFPRDEWEAATAAGWARPDPDAVFFVRDGADGRTHFVAVNPLNEWSYGTLARKLILADAGGLTVHASDCRDAPDRASAFREANRECEEGEKADE